MKHKCKPIYQCRFVNTYQAFNNKLIHVQINNGLVSQLILNRLVNNYYYIMHVKINSYDMFIKFLFFIFL